MAGLQGELAHRNPSGGVQVDRPRILNGPPSLLQQAIDVHSCLFFRSHVSQTDGFTLPTTLQSWLFGCKAMSGIGHHRAHGFSQP